MSTGYIIACVAIASIIGYVISSCYIGYRSSFRSIRKRHVGLYTGLDGDLTDIKLKRRAYLDSMLKLPYEDVTVTAIDGKKLYARYYSRQDSAPVAILFHGYKSRAQRDFACGTQILLDMGYNVLLVDQRGHGESEGKVIYFGTRERYDAKTWAEYVVSRFGEDTKIFLYGISMGGATVLMASELDLPKNVVGIIADCPFSTVSGIIKKVCQDMKLPVWLIYPFVKMGAFMFAGFKPDCASPVQAVKNTSLPILLIHGENDRFVPCSMSDEIAAANEKITYYKIPDAPHALAIIYDTENYVSELKKFTEKVLGE